MVGEIMAKKANCYTSMKAAINALISNFSDDKFIPGMLEGFKGNKAGAKLQIERQVKQLKAELVDVMEKSGLPIDQAVIQAKDSVKRKLIDITSTIRAANDRITDLDTMLRGAKTERDVNSVVADLMQNTLDAKDAEARSFDAIVANLLLNLDTAGTKVGAKLVRDTQRIFQDHRVGGTKLTDYLNSKGYSDPQREMFKARIHGQHEDPIMNLLGTMYKNADGINIPRVKNRAPYFNDLQDYTVPMVPNVDRLNRVGSEAFLGDKELREVLDFDKILGKKHKPKDVDEFMLTYYEQSSAPPAVSTGKFSDSEGIFGRKELHFKKDAGWEVQYKFLKKYGSEDMDIFRDSLHHMRSLNEKNVVYNFHGPDVEFNMSIIADHITKKLPELDASSIRGTLDNHSFFLQKGKAYTAAEVAAHNMGKIFNDVSSASLVTASIFRDILYDQTTQAAIVERQLTGEGASLIKASHYMGRLLKNIIWKREGIKEMGELYDALGFATLISHHAQYDGLGRLMKIDTQKAPKTGQAALKTEKISQWASMASGSDRTLHVAKVFATSKAMKIFTSALDGKFRDKGAMETLTNLGIDEEVLDALSKAPRKTIKDAHGWKDFEIFDINNILRMTDDQIKPIKRSYETTTDARKRVYFATRNAIQQLADALSARPKLKSNLNDPNARGVGKVALGQMFKFTGIMIAQWQELMKAVAAGTRINPATIDSMSQASMYSAIKNNPVPVVNSILGAMFGGIMYQWIVDLTNGKTPRDLDSKMLADATTFGGHGGGLNVALQQYRYNDEGVGLPIAAPIGALRRFESKALREMQGGRKRKGRESNYNNEIHNLMRFIPGLNLWYARAARDYLLQEQLGMKESKAKRKRDKKRGQRRLWE